MTLRHEVGCALALVSAALTVKSQDNHDQQMRIIKEIDLSVPAMATFAYLEPGLMEVWKCKLFDWMLQEDEDKDDTAYKNYGLSELIVLASMKIEVLKSLHRAGVLVEGSGFRVTVRLKSIHTILDLLGKALYRTIK